MFQVLATSTFKFPNIFEQHNVSKHKSHRPSHKCQTLVSKVKTYEQKKVEKFNKLWSSFTEHGKDDVHHAIKFHEDIFKTFGMESEDDSSGIESEVDVVENDPDPDHDLLEMDNLEDVQDDNDEYFEK